MRLTIENEPVPSRVTKAGGTWDTIETADGMAGSGNLDDAEVKSIQQELGLLTTFTSPEMEQLNWKLTQILYERFRRTRRENLRAEDFFKSWCPEFGDFVTAPYFPVFSGDSGHFDRPFVTAMITHLVKQALKDPTTPAIGGLGTDTADIALLSIYDALTFDTRLAPLVLTGANKSHREENSDAPDHFRKLARTTHYPIGDLVPSGVYAPEGYFGPGRARSGGYWLFGNSLFHAWDVVKVDPAEMRTDGVEGYGTFWAPYGSDFKLDKLFEEDAYEMCKTAPDYMTPGPDHILNQLTLSKLYKAIGQVYTLDLGSQNTTESSIREIFNPDYHAIVVATHGMGTVNDRLRAACVEATKKGKIIVAGSRCLLAETNNRYVGSLPNANEHELIDSGNKIVTAHKLNKTMARALAIRALLEKRGQIGTQMLIDDYTSDRWPYGAEYPIFKIESTWAKEEEL